jgi:hypothetical protein
LLRVLLELPQTSVQLLKDGVYSDIEQKSAH